MRKRNIDRIPRGRRNNQLPVAQLVWKVTAKEVSGAALHPASFLDEEQARGHADWWHNHPGIVDVQIHDPHGKPRMGVVPTAQDEKIGSWLAAALDDAKVCPSMKLDINRWMDSKAWGHGSQKETA